MIVSDVLLSLSLYHSHLPTTFLPRHIPAAMIIFIQCEPYTYIKILSSLTRVRGEGGRHGEGRRSSYLLTRAAAP